MPPPKFKLGFFPSHQRWAVDYDPDYLKALSKSDPEAYAYLLKFLAEEYGTRGTRPEAYRKARSSANDAMSEATGGIDVDAVADSDAGSVEDRLNSAIDNRHILNGLSRAVKTSASPREYDTALRGVQKAASAPLPSKPRTVRRTGRK